MVAYLHRLRDISGFVFKPIWLRDGVLFPPYRQVGDGAYQVLSSRQGGRADELVQGHDVRHGAGDEAGAGVGDGLAPVPAHGLPAHDHHPAKFRPLVQSKQRAKSTS